MTPKIVTIFILLYMQRQRNALSLLHEVHVQQRALLDYASSSSANPTVLISIPVAIAALQIELVVDVLVVEHVLHHLLLTLPPFPHHVVRHRLLPVGLHHRRLVDAQHLAQQRGQPAEQALGHVSSRHFPTSRPLEVRMRVADKHLHLALRNHLQQVLPVARHEELGACTLLALHAPTAFTAVHVLRRGYAQRQHERVRVAHRADRFELRREVDLACDAQGHAVLFCLHHHLHMVVVFVQQVSLACAAAFYAPAVHQLANRAALLQVLAGRHGVGEHAGGLLQAQRDEVVVGVRRQLRVAEEQLGRQGNLP